MVYQFLKVYEMDTVMVIFEVIAKDMHEAMQRFYEKYSDYDILSINGEWI